MMKHNMIQNFYRVKLSSLLLTHAHTPAHAQTGARLKILRLQNLCRCNLGGDTGSLDCGWGGRVPVLERTGAQ